jgi:hypothetical protein
VVGADETRWPLMGSKEKSRWYAWVGPFTSLRWNK